MCSVKMSDSQTTQESKTTGGSATPVKILIDDNGNYPTDSAVFIRNLCKQYNDGPPVLQNLCMNVQRGTIYGLLGSSGCGKTTILSCIVGLRKWDSGEILVFGKKPGTKGSGIPGRKVGYMPQHLALYQQLSIREMIQFYGRIYNMSDLEIEEKWRFLNDLLKLPPNFKLISDLSGGQKRRASLALALIQAPDLVILDEPTVGLDPLLRRSIWEHLYKIVRTLGTTVIVTTHYIEEARFSNTIGIVRKGKILVESTPTSLLNSFKCDLLEEVVLQLCRKDESCLKGLKGLSKFTPECDSEKNKVTFTSNWKEDVSSSIVSNQVNGIFRKDSEFDCDRSKAIKRKEEDGLSSPFLSKIRKNPVYEAFQRTRGLTTVMILSFLRHPLFLVFTMLMPTIHGTLTLLTVGTKPKALQIGVVDGELYNWTAECSLPKHYGNSCDFSALSCKYLNQLEKNELYRTVAVNTEEEGRRMVELGEAWGYLSFPFDYSQHSLDLAAAKRFSTNETIIGSRIRARLDHSQYISAFFMARGLVEAYLAYVTQLAETCQLGGKETELPLNFREPVYGTNVDNYTDYMIPGVILICLVGINGVMTSIIFIGDHKQGTQDRAKVAGLAVLDIMLSHMITQELVAALQIILWSTVLYFVFGVFLPIDALTTYTIICALGGLCGSTLGLFTGILFGDELTAILAAVFWGPLMLLFGGVFWPRQLMSAFWQFIGSLLPTTVPINSLRSVIIRGLGITHPLVWPGLVVFAVWIVLFCVGFIILYKRAAKS